MSNHEKLLNARVYHRCCGHGRRTSECCWWVGGTAQLSRSRQVSATVRVSEVLPALLGMLNSCASGVTVVNIDNGFGAGYSAALINRLST